MLILVLFSSYVQVCQVAYAHHIGSPAGSKDTSFAVDSSGNVVISYGAIMDSTGYTRYPNTVLLSVLFLRKK